MTFQSSVARLEKEARREAADASDWYLAPAAQPLLVRFDYLERLADKFAGEGFKGLSTAAYDEACDIEGGLDTLRWAAIEDAQGLLNPLGLDEYHDEDACDEIADNAPTVDEALDYARRNRLGGAMFYGEVTVTDLGNGRFGVAA